MGPAYESELRPETNNTPKIYVDKVLKLAGMLPLDLASTIASCKKQDDAKQELDNAKSQYTVEINAYLKSENLTSNPQLFTSLIKACKQKTQAFENSLNKADKIQLLLGLHILSYQFSAGKELVLDFSDVNTTSIAHIKNSLQKVTARIPINNAINAIRSRIINLQKHAEYADFVSEKLFNNHYSHTRSQLSRYEHLQILVTILSLIKNEQTAAALRRFNDTCKTVRKDWVKINRVLKSTDTDILSSASTLLAKYGIRSNKKTIVLILEHENKEVIISELVKIRLKIKKQEYRNEAQKTHVQRTIEVPYEILNFLHTSIQREVKPTKTAIMVKLFERFLSWPVAEQRKCIALKLSETPEDDIKKPLAKLNQNNFSISISLNNKLKKACEKHSTTLKRISCSLIYDEFDRLQAARKAIESGMVPADITITNNNVLGNELYPERHEVNPGRFS